MAVKIRVLDIRDISKQLADMELDVKQNEADRALDKSKKNLEQIKTHYEYIECFPVTIVCRDRLGTYDTQNLLNTT